MPLRESKIKPRSWEDIGEQFAVFYASKDNGGIMWCPVRSPQRKSKRSSRFVSSDRSQDCRAVKDIVEETFDKENAPAALIIYVGQKPE